MEHSESPISRGRSLSAPVQMVPMVQASELLKINVVADFIRKSNKEQLEAAVSPLLQIVPGLSDALYDQIIKFQQYRG